MLPSLRPSGRSNRRPSWSPNHIVRFLRSTTRAILFSYRSAATIVVMRNVRWRCFLRWQQLVAEAHLSAGVVFFGQINT